MKYHTFWRRVAASLLDWLVFLPLSMAVLAVIYVKGEISLSSLVIISVLGILCKTVYFVAMTAKLGQTLGKMASGVKVVRCDGSMLECKESFLRYLPFLLLLIIGQGFGIYWFSGVDRIDLIAEMTGPQWTNWAYIIWIVAELIVLASNSKRRAIHDFIAGSEVIVKKHEAKAGMDQQLR